MERQIEALEERLKSEPAWEQALDSLDKYVIDLSYRATIWTMHAFAHEEYPSETQQLAAWRSFEVQFLQFLSELDRTGASEILGRLAPEYLAGFSFSEAREFREYEERPIALEIPQEAWDRFWRIADVTAPQLFEDMRTNQPFAFRPMFEMIHNRFERPSFAFEHLSPFKWSKALAAALGYSVAAVDTILIVPTSGVGLASLAGGLAATIYSAG